MLQLRECKNGGIFEQGEAPSHFYSEVFAYLSVMFLDKYNCVCGIDCLAPRSPRCEGCDVSSTNTYCPVLVAAMYDRRSKHSGMRWAAVTMGRIRPSL